MAGLVLTLAGAVPVVAHGASTTLVPSRDRAGTTGTWGREDSTWVPAVDDCGVQMSVYWDALAEDIDAPDDSFCTISVNNDSFIYGTAGTGEIQFELTDTPATFGSASLITVRYRALAQSGFTGTLQVEVRKADGTLVGTPLCRRWPRRTPTSRTRQRRRSPRRTSTVCSSWSGRPEPATCRCRA